MRHVAGGVLIVVEGIGGSGKSTLCASLADAVERSGWTVRRTREPGGTHLGTDLRRILLTDSAVAPWAEAFLFEADRAQSFAEVIEPALIEGHVVVSDRGPFGTVAYQGHGRGLDVDLINQMSLAAWRGRRADLVLVVDIEPATAMRRKRGAPETDRFDEEALEFQGRVRAGYLAAATQFGERALVLDGNLPAEELLRAASSKASNLLAALPSTQI